MLGTITRLILKRLFFTITFVTFILMVGVWLTQSLRFIQVIVNHNVSILDYFSLVSFLLPDLLTQVVPICLFISILFIYNRLDQDHELIALRASGLSNIQLAKPVMYIAVGVVFFVSLMNFYLVPLSYRIFRDQEHQIRSELTTVFFQEGAFNTMRGITVYLKNRDPDGTLNNIFIYYVDKDSDKPMSYTIMAQQGRVQNTLQGPHLMLQDGLRQELNLKTRQSAQFKFQELSFDLSRMIQDAQPRTVKPYERPVWELLFSNTQNDPKMRAEAHQRLVQPFLVLLLTLIGLNAILSTAMQRRPSRLRIIVAMGLAIASYVLVMTLIHMNGRSEMILPLNYVLILSAIIVGWRYLASDRERVAA